MITIEEVFHDSEHDLGIDPGLRKDGVESHLQQLLAEQIETLGKGWRLVRREYPTPIGPVDILCRDADGATVAVGLNTAVGAGTGTGNGNGSGTAPGRKHWAVEIKRKATIDAVEQLTRYVELLNRDPLLAPVGGVLAAQSIAPQARTLAEDRGFRCVVLDYDEMRGAPKTDLRLF